MIDRFLVLKHEEEAYKTVLGIFDFLFRFQNMALNISCSQNSAFLWKKGSKIWEGDRLSKIPSTVLERRS